MDQKKMMQQMEQKFAQKYEFRLAKRDDIEAIMQYIDEAWKKGHLLSWNRELFEYEFCDGEEVHFLLAIDRETGCIEGLDGYYYTSSKRKDFDIWGSMWSVRKDHKNLPMLGIEIANQYYKQIGYRYEIGLGVNRLTATPLQRDYFEVATGVMYHYYILNELKSYHITQVEHFHPFYAYSEKDVYQLIRMITIDDVKKFFDFDKKITTYPVKDAWYVNHRFFSHPVYQYKVFALVKDGEADALLVLKTTEYNGNKAMSIVDYMGDIKALKYVGNQLAGLMDEKTEFIDFICYGYDEQEILRAGFSKLEDGDSNIIPSHFEPYELKNVEYWFNSDAKENFVICKADADQDRPNQI